MINKGPINLGMSVDYREFSRQMAQVAAGSKDALHVTVNKQSFYAVVEARKRTPAVSRDTIERELKVVGYKLEIGKRGKHLASSKKRKAKNAIIDHSASLIHLIINRRLGRNKKKGLHGAQMRDAVTKELTKRFKSVGTLKAGWTRAIQKLGAAVGFKRDSKHSGASAFVKGFSQVKLAKPGWNPECRITYNTNSFDKDHKPYIDKRVGEALVGALQSEARFMAKRLRDGLVTGIKRKLKPAPMTHSQKLAEIMRVMRGG